MRRSLFALLLVVAACARGQDPTVPTGATSAPSTTTTATTGATTTAAPSTTTTSPPVAPAQPATASCPAIPARAEPLADRPSYDLELDVQLDANVVVGTEVVRFTPDLPTDRLVFRLWPNGPRPSQAGARLDVESVLLDGEPAATDQPDATTLVVPVALAAGETVEARVAFRLTLPGPVNDRISRRGDTVRLGTFHPLLAWEPGVGWATEPPTALFAEASTAPVADWRLRVRVPEGLTVLAAGEEVDGEWRAEAMRELALAVGRFRVVEGQAGAPHPVPVTVAVETTLADSEHAYLDHVVRSLTDFGVRFGPYPFPRYTLVITPDLGGGIEYPSFVHQGPGTNDRTTPHEVAHMWFYALVGNSQGRDPWLDEGLATYAEGRFLGTLPSLVARDIPASGRGRAGEPMTFWDAGRGSAYYRSVYVQGAQAVAALGQPDRVDCALRLHVARNAHRIATNAAFVDAVDEVFPEAATVLARFGIASR